MENDIEQICFAEEKKKKKKNPDETHEMVDKNKKEMTDQEMESFDEKRSEAMQAFSEVISRSK